MATSERLRGYVVMWWPQKEYGFIGVKGVKDEEGQEKQWHFHINSVRKDSRQSIGMGMIVEFTPMPVPKGNTTGGTRKRDKATAVEVVG